MSTRTALILVGLFSLLWTPSVLAQEEPQTPDDGRVDLATDKGLQFLAATQLPDGSWPTNCGPSTGITSVAVLAFMAKGNVPGQGPYGETLNRGIRFVLSQAQPTGVLCAKNAQSAAMYNHGMSTLMLSESLGMCDADLASEIRPILSRAVKLTLKAQGIQKNNPAHVGGWRYDPASADSDLSCTGWQLLSLRAARECGADVPKEAIDAAVDYIKRSAGGGGFRYQATDTWGSSRSLSGTGILSLEICSRHQEPEALTAGNFLVEHPPLWDPAEGRFFYYSAYYCSQAMFQLGSRYWDIERPRLEAILISVQRPDGSWPICDNVEQLGGPTYYTSMAVLTLSVKYHYLPIYQR